VRDGMSAATTLRAMPAVPAAPAVSQPITDAWPVKRVVATALFTDRSGRVLVVEPSPPDVLRHATGS